MPLLLKACPRCQGDVEQRQGAEYSEFRSCVQCGWEDYERRLVPVTRSTSLIAAGSAYNLPYIGEHLALTGRVCTVRVAYIAPGRLSAPMAPVVTPECPTLNCGLPMWVMSITGGAHRARVKARGASTYRCADNHRIDIVMGEKTGWQ